MATGFIAASAASVSVRQAASNSRKRGSEFANASAGRLAPLHKTALAPSAASASVIGGVVIAIQT